MVKKEENVKSKVIYNEYVMPKYFKPDKDNVFKNEDNANVNYLNFISNDEIIETILKHDKALIDRLQYKLSETPSVNIHVYFDKTLKQPCYEVVVKVKNVEVFKDKIYQYFTESGLEYEKRTGKIPELDKDLFKIINKNSLNNGITSYKQNLLEFHKKLVEEEYTKRLRNVNELML